MFGVRRTRPFFSAPHLKKPLARNPGGLQPPLPRSGHPKRDASGRGIALALGRRKASFPVRPGRRRTSFGKRKSDPQTDVAPGRTRGRNVRSKNQCSMCPAIHTKSRSWLRSSSTREPSDPLLRVVFFFADFRPFCMRSRGYRDPPFPEKLRGEHFCPDGRSASRRTRVLEKLTAGTWEPRRRKVRLLFRGPSLRA